MVRFIKTQYLKDKTIIENNVDDQLLIPNIERGQEIEIQQLLGTNLYNAMKTKVMNNDVTGDYKTLMEDYIQPCLVEWSLYYSLPYFYTKLENSGMIKKDTENTIYAELSDLKYIRNDVRDIAEFYGKRLIDYLCYNTDLFPEYNSELRKSNEKN